MIRSCSSGLFHCLNAKTGKVYWTYDLYAACWTTALLVDGEVYIADEDGDVTIFRHSADPRFAMKATPGKDSKLGAVIHGIWDGDLINECHFPSAVYTTPIVANNVLYVATRNALYAIEQPADP